MKRNDGTAFERQIGQLLRLRPGVDVKSHQRIKGKDVDLLVESYDALTGVQRIAVECRDHKSPLTREQVAATWADYAPLIGPNGVNRVLLVTRNGVVANASAALEDEPFTHKTERELFDAVISAGQLALDAKHAFEQDSLDRYYQPTSAYPVDIDLALSDYDTYYGPAADYGVAVLNASDWHRQSIADKRADVARLLERYAANENGSGSRTDAPEIDALVTVLASRTCREPVPLTSLVDDWLARDLSDAQPTGLALLGSYGTGKSSFARALAARQGKAYLDGQTDRVPLLIELRRFGSQGIESLIADELSNRHGIPNASFQVFQELNRRGRFLLILDGFDEMKEGMSGDLIAFNLSELNRLQVGAAKVLLCGRPTVFERQDEQLDRLSGEKSFHASARYLQVEIAPMTVQRVLDAMSGYLDARRGELGDGIDTRVDELRHELKHDAHLRDLLSRPVHYPMLLRVLPRWKGKLADMSRTDLYEAFIDQTIKRELKPGRPSGISAAQRLRFASDLAIAMFALGESRSIRYSQIPPEIVTAHRRGRDTVEVTQRELIRSCFLERKPPDILFFPHKSFGEYLVARRLAEILSKSTPNTDRLDIRMTPEIASFVSELVDAAGWRRALGNCIANDSLLRFFLSKLASDPDPIPHGTDLPIAMLTLRQALSSNGTLAPLLLDDYLQAAPEMLRHHLAAALARLARDGYKLAHESKDILDYLMAKGNADDISTVHAYRGLAALAPELAERARTSDPARWTAWQSKGWVARQA